MSELTATLYRVRKGVVTETQLVRGKPFEIPVDIESSDGPGLVRADVDWGYSELPLWPLKILPLVLEVVEVIVPWGMVYAAPSFLDSAGTRHTFWGRAHRRTDVMLLTTTQYGPRALETALHEAWHCIEQVLTEAEKSTVYGATRRGLVWGDPRYMDTATERSARAFAAWAYSRLECREQEPAGRWQWLQSKMRHWSRPPHERIFEAVLTGKVAKRALARRWVRKGNLSPCSLAVAERERSALRTAETRRHPKSLAA